MKTYQLIFFLDLFKCTVFPQAAILAKWSMSLDFLCQAYTWITSVHSLGVLPWNRRIPRHKSNDKKIEKHFCHKISSINTIVTFLNASSLQTTVFPQPWIVTEFCVMAMNITSIRCSSLGSRCHLVLQSVTLNESNRLVTNSPSTQNPPMAINDQNVINSVKHISLGFGMRSDWKNKSGNSAQKQI